MTPNRAASVAIAEEKAAGQRLLNVLIVLLLLAALVIITWISLQTPSTPGELADSKDPTLEQLGDLKVPNVQTGQPVAANEVSLGHGSSSPEDDLTTGLNLGSDQAIQPATDAQPETQIAGLDTEVKPSPTSPEINTATPSAQVQLRPPVPMGNSNNSLAQQLVPRQSEVLDLDLPNSNATRAETVSNPSNQAVTSTPSLELPDNNDAAQSDTATVSSPRTATNPGASPSPWDGAQNGKVETSTTDLGSHAQQPATTVQSGGLTISEPLSAQVSVPNNGSTLAAKSDSSTSVFAKPSQSAETTSATSTSAGSDQAVTVGGGSSVPYNLATTRSTSTPDFDSVATIQQYQSYLQQQRLSGNQPAGSSTSPAPGPSASSKQPINSFAIGAETPISGQRQPQIPNPYVKGAPNSYVASGQVPGGITGPAAGPYVPTSTPATAPSGQAIYSSVPGQMASGPTAAPGSLPTYQMPPAGAVPGGASPNGVAPGAGYALPPRGQTINNPYSQPGAGYPTGAGAPTGSGYPNTSYPPPAYSVPNYSNPNPPTAPNFNRPAAGYMPPGVQGGVSYPVSNPFPAGPTPPSLMGPTGYATQPSGDFSAPRPVTGTMGSAVSLPNGIH